MWYLTYYEEYPIYEPAEGGYYYAGNQMVESEEFQSVGDAFRKAKEAYKDSGLEWMDDGSTDEEQIAQITETLKKSLFEGWSPYVVVAMEQSKYIGEQRELVIETKQGCAECGWHPYE